MVFVSGRKRHFWVSYKAHNPNQGGWPWLVLQSHRLLKQAFSLPDKDRKQALRLGAGYLTRRPHTGSLVLRFTKTLTNKIEGLIFQFRRKPQRYP
jgi:hypothetical protein